MSALADLFRPEIRALKPYEAARYADGCLRLNANETPWRPAGDPTERGLNRYPEVRPERLRERLAAHYGVAREQLLVTRGSSEGIELLIRALCRAGRDGILICPPTFGMYRAYADIQGARVTEVPLRRDDGYAIDVDAILAAWRAETRLLFLCSPNNPTGNRLPTARIARLATELDGRALVVVDGAYLEFAAEDPTRALLAQHENVVVLRTLSKALGLAGTRCGALLGDAAVVELLGRLLPPYCLPTPCVEAVLAALAPAALDTARARIAELIAERDWLAGRLAELAGIRRVWPSEANFLLVESGDPAACAARAERAGILIRDFSSSPLLPGGLRITVSARPDNERLLAALE
ncbi:MAG: histidinol-phosphate transaminase [Gammaproteobacteria bacterium]|nr:MAG: histidinol-phosphate transaminase [Gammaproteobacteria bacterium]